MHGVNMFSLVTALVSPHAIETLRSKKETLVSTLTENANVLCFQPNDGICLLQGEWENVKKAYAILEEFYFRAQAEIMVREMLKNNISQQMTTLAQNPPKKEHSLDIADWSNSLLSSILPLIGQQSENLPTGKGFGTDRLKTWLGSELTPLQENASSKPQVGVKDYNCKEGRCSKNTDGGHVDNTTFGNGDMNGQIEDGVAEDAAAADDEEDDNDEPPILSKEGPCSSDVISLSSEMSEPKEMDLYDASHLLTNSCPATSNCSQVLNDLPCSSENANDRRLRLQQLAKVTDDNDIDRGPPQLSDNRCFEMTKGELAEKKGNSLAPYVIQQVSNPSHMVSQQVLGSTAAFHTQQYLSDRLSTGCKLPQFSSLLLGSTTLPQGIPTWQYADLYSMHLSALQSLHIKQEPSSLISSSDLVQVPNLGEEDLKNDLGYRFNDDAQMQEMRCSHCSKTYRSEARMKEHVRTHEKDYVPVLHSCPKCSKSFTYRHNMVVHLRRFHYGWQPAKRHVCRVCGIRFQKPYLLRLHEHKAHVMPA